MKRTLLGLSLALAWTAVSSAQDQNVYFDKQEEPFRLKGDILFRREWTRELFGDAADQGRWRGGFRPRLEMSHKRLSLMVGGELNYSSDENTKPAAGDPPLTLLRDNYKSRDARLDLASARLRLFDWLRVEGGRMVMPVALTEMIWDRDLRPQGAAATLSFHDSQGAERFSVTGLGARGSHTFDDDKTDMLLVSAAIGKQTGKQRAEFRGSYLEFRNLEGLEPILRRQNSRLTPGGLVPDDFQVIDLTARIRSEGALPSEIVVDYAWNQKLNKQKGFWLALVLGSVETSRSRGEYVYAKVDRDVTVAAYAGDDFHWGTGWEGHRVDFGVRASQGSSIHTVAQIIRFKDSADLEDSPYWHDGGYPVWGQFEVIMSHGTVANEHFWDAHAHAPGLGG
jgi:hypothetical protein